MNETSLKSSHPSPAPQLLRVLSTSSSQPIHWRSTRAYVVADKMHMNPDPADATKGTLQVRACQVLMHPRRRRPVTDLGI
jgi:hypothetical protein